MRKYLLKENPYSFPLSSIDGHRPCVCAFSMNLHLSNFNTGLSPKLVELPDTVLDGVLLLASVFPPE